MPTTPGAPPEHNDRLTQIGVVPGVLTPAQCARAIELAQGFAPTEGRVGTRDAERAEIRRSQIWFFEPAPETAEVFDAVARVVATLNQGYRLELTGFATGCQIARYAEDVQGHYDWHIDLGVGATSRRKLSASIQLTPGDAYEGGDLEFHLSGLDRAKMRQQGTLIAFPSFLEHRVTPVTRGERWSLVVWVDGPPYR